jgi:hypothetical protein
VWSERDGGKVERTEVRGASEDGGEGAGTTQVRLGIARLGGRGDVGRGWLSV